MDNFNAKRFGMLMKRDIIYGKKNIVNYTFYMFMLFATPWLPNLLITGGSQEIFTGQEEIMMQIGTIYMMLGVFLVISGIFAASNLSNKQKMIADKMLPASDLEKFLTRCIFALPGCLAIGLTAMLAADMLRSVISLTLGYGMPAWYLTCIFDGEASGLIMGLNNTDGSILALSVTGAVMWQWTTHSFYVLGGMLFRRHQFVLTSMVGVVSRVIVMAMVANIAPLIPEFDDMAEYGEVEKLMHMFGWLAVALATALTALNYWLAYKIYTRMQIINNKWINV